MCDDSTSSSILGILPLLAKQCRSQRAVDQPCSVIVLNVIIVRALLR